MNIRNLVKNDFEVVSPEVHISELESRLARDSYVVVKENDQYLGIVSRFQDFEATDQPVRRYLKQLPEIDCHSGLKDICTAMQKQGQVIVPVFDRKKFIGVLSLYDVVFTISEYCQDLESRVEQSELPEEARITRLKKEIKEYKELINVFSHYKNSIEKVLKTKSDLLADVSHEIRNPLHIILSYARKGLNKISEDTNQIIHQYFLRVRDAGEKILILMDDLLDLSKLEAGKSRYEFKVFSLSDLVETVLEEYRYILESKKIAVNFVRPEEDDSSKIDRNRIMQVIRNLLSNAYKYSPEKGKIKIEIKRKENEISFYIIDWGYGIPEDEFGDLFTKYNRTSQTDIEGTGLGLSIAYKIINDHKGRIHAQPNPEGGSIFSFTLPAET